MTGPGTTARTSQQAGKATRQLSSHAHLLHDLSQAPAPVGRSPRGRPNAIVVPAARPASSLRGVIRLAVELETELVVLGSHQTQTAQAAERMRTHGARGLVAHVPPGYSLPTMEFATASGRFAGVNGGRESNLSVKRNLGLLLARLRGWRKVVFVDDDITVSRSAVARLATQLESHPIAGMACPRFADNSVVCHARRLAGFEQDVFVTGAVLGVNCMDLPLPFFPDIYNEDWFFFAEAAARHRLAKAGEAHQTRYDPYLRPARAAHEEFGDLLAEGLYALLPSVARQTRARRPDEFVRELTTLASERYWTRFIEARLRGIRQTQARLLELTLSDTCGADVPAALQSLQMAEARYEAPLDPITTARCAEFLALWGDDVALWDSLYRHAKGLGTVRDAMDRLQVDEWLAVR